MSHLPPERSVWTEFGIGAFMGAIYVAGLLGTLYGLVRFVKWAWGD